MLTLPKKDLIWLFLAAVCLVAFGFNSFGALAQAADAVATATPAPSGVSLPVGTWAVAVGSFLKEFVTPLVLLGLGVLARKLPAQAGALVNAMITEQVVARAVDWGFSVTEGVAKGKTLTLPQASAVVTAAEQYAVANAPAWAKAVGDLLRPKIVARIGATGSLPADAHADALAVALPKAA